MQDAGPWISRGVVDQPLLGHSPLVCSQESGCWETGGGADSRGSLEGPLAFASLGVG